MRSPPTIASFLLTLQLIHQHAKMVAHVLDWQMAIDVNVPMALKVSTVTVTSLLEVIRIVLYIHKSQLEHMLVNSAKLLIDEQIKILFSLEQRIC